MSEISSFFLKYLFPTILSPIQVSTLCNSNNALIDVAVFSGENKIYSNKQDYTSYSGWMYRDRVVLNLKANYLNR